MKIKHILLFILFLLTVCSGCLRAQSSKKTALTPPMGWNSYDAYDWRINEKEYKENVDFMAGKLLKYGWDYAVIDYLWFHVDREGNLPVKQRKPVSMNLKYEQNGKPLDSIAVDKYGRLIPDEIRFPSSSGGKGFKPLADYVHSKGMKFGIHIMRGIPRYAVYYNLPIKGTKYKAKDIADVDDICPWQNTMYGVDCSKPGAQEYYNSMVELYAEWGVDFIKADNEMTPYFHQEEVKLLSNAIKKTGRPIVLSLSPGSIFFSQAEFLTKNANMWRISDDFWDGWESLKEKFEMLNSWSNYSRPGSWPDADMLPIGHLSLNNSPVGKERYSRFTMAEHYTLLTLYAIAKSPLIIGSDLPTIPDSTLSFLTNAEVIYVNQHSVKNRMIYKLWDQKIMWMAEDPDTGDKFLALFNTGNEERNVSFDFKSEKLEPRYKIRDLWKHEDKGIYEKKFSAVLPPHSAGLYRMSKVK
jgi:alpha-galactosidase